MTRLVPAMGLLLLLGCDGAEAPTDAGSPPPSGDAGALVDAGGPPPTDAGGATDAGPPADAGTAPSGDPSARGAATVTTTSASVSRGARTIPVVAHLPSTGAGPLVVFAPGFQLDTAFYVPTLEHVASHGFVVVRADPPASAFSADHVAMRDDLIAVIDWALANLDLTSGVLVAGHSLGGKLATMVAGADARVTGLFAIDPVNGGNPLTGYSASLPDIVPAVTQTLDVPVAYLGETENADGGTFGMACAPRDQNYQTFYEGTTAAPAVYEHTFAGADHMDFLDTTSGCGFACSACTEGSADSATVSASTRTLFAAFARRHLAADTAAEAWLTGARPLPGVSVRAR